jgi:hypothetical protein
MTLKRAKTVVHAEYEILKWILEKVSIYDLRQQMAKDEISATRFDKGAENALNLVNNMKERRRHNLPSDHIDYKEKAE